MVPLRAHLACGFRSRIPWLASLLAAGSLLPPGAARAGDTNAVLQGWLDAQANLQTWKADFTQTRLLKTLKQPLVAPGRAWFQPPSRFRWELGTPTQTIALRRADELLVIYPLLKRAERFPFQSRSSNQWRETLELLEVGFPRDRTELESRFHILSLAEKGPGWSLVLQPRSTIAQRLIQEVRVELALDGFALLGTELVLADGSTLRNDFTNAVLNSAFDAAVFTWEPPRDFKVTQPLD